MHSHGLDVTVGLTTQLIQVVGACGVLICVGVELEYGNISSHDDMQWIGMMSVVTEACNQVGRGDLQ